MPVRLGFPDLATRTFQMVSRGTLVKPNDKHMWQEAEVRSRKDSRYKDIEIAHGYGFTSVPISPEGESQETPEMLIFFPDGNRSHPVAMPFGDRRHRPRGLKEGENSQHDDLGQMTLIRRDATYMLTLDTAAQGQQQEQKRFTSVRHVEKDKQQRPQSQQGQGQQQQQNDDEDFKHEGKTVNAEVKIDKETGDLVAYAEAQNNQQGEVKARVKVDRQGNVTVTAATNVNITAGTKITLKAGEIVLDGTVRLGSPNASTKVEGTGLALAERVYIQAGTEQDTD